MAFWDSPEVMIGGGFLAGGPVGALIGAGGYAGGQKDQSTQSWTNGMNAGSATTSETTGQNAMMEALRQYQQMVGAGPGASDVSAGAGASRELAEMLKRYSQAGGSDPTGDDISRSQGLASSLFGAQRTAMQQNFGDQLTQANRQAALMGRSVNDPILKAKLAQEQTRQASLLDANQGAWATQYAMGQPMQRLGFATNRVNVMQGLASQALANRQALAAMGEGVMNNERNFRLQTATRFGTGTAESGGGFKGMLSGVLGTSGAVMGMAGQAAAMAGGMPPAGGNMGAGALGSSAPVAQAPVTTPGYTQAQNYFNAPNPYASGGAGLQVYQAPSNPFSSYQMGSSYGFGQPRSYSLGG
jgi:hypothetical protein